MRSAGPSWERAVCTVPLAFALWFLTFFVPQGSFWIKISLSAALLAALALSWGRMDVNRFGLGWAHVLVGVASAGVLYGIFWLGKVVSGWLLPFSSQQVGAIYQLGGDTPRWVVALLLLLVTGPSEEIYWRGFLQENLMQRMGRNAGWLVTTAIYALVHIWTWNLMLIGAAAVAGLFWGGMYRFLGRLTPVIVSHSLWSCTIFAVLPMA